MADRCQRHAMTEDAVDLLDALRALAFMGDLSMGQPVDHSPVFRKLGCNSRAACTLKAALSGLL